MSTYSETVADVLGALHGWHTMSSAPQLHRTLVWAPRHLGSTVSAIWGASPSSRKVLLLSLITCSTEKRARTKTASDPAGECVSLRALSLITRDCGGDRQQCRTVRFTSPPYTRKRNRERERERARARAWALAPYPIKQQDIWDRRRDTHCMAAHGRHTPRQTSRDHDT